MILKSAPQPPDADKIRQILGGTSHKHMTLLGKKNDRIHTVFLVRSTEVSGFAIAFVSTYLEQQPKDTQIHRIAFRLE